MEKGNEIKTVVPILRFPEFREMNGWEKIRVKDFGKVITGNTPSKNEETYWNGDFAWITAQDFNGKFIYDSISKLTQFGRDKSKIIPKDSVLVTCIASIGLNAINKIECSTNQQINSICCYQKYYNEYVYYTITYNIDRLKQLAGQTAVPIITKKIFEDFEIYATKNYDEQQKIADCLSSLDELIEATAQKVEALKEHKKGLMQRLFPAEGKNMPDLRFPKFQASEKWERKIIQDICNITTGNKNTQDKKENGIYPFFVRSPKVERIDSWSFDGEAILTAGDGVGVGKIFHYYVGKMGVHQRVYLLYDIQCNSKYLYYFFSEFFYERVKKMSAKNSVDSVRKDMISDMPLLLPSSQEQQRIADCLSSLDELIEATSRKVEILKEHKKGLMQQLFPKI